MGRVLLLGLVSAVEYYFRSVLARVIQVCPICFGNAARLPIPLGSVFHYGLEDLGYGLLESSLASSTELDKATEKITGLKLIKASDSTKAALAQYNEVCNFRHAAVHNRGDLNAANFRELGINIEELEGTRLVVNYKNLNTAAEVCLNMARAYNSSLYQHVLSNWLAVPLFDGTWQQDQDTYVPLYELFRSRRDAVGPTNAYNAYRGILPIIKARLAAVSADG
jgi:hypothetical protein